jgi:glycosyltransferase involved in cell wall biosynthesis
VKKTKVLQLTIGLNKTVQQFDLFEEVAQGFCKSDFDFTFGVLTGEADQTATDRLPCNTVFFNYKKKHISGIIPRALPSLYRYIKDNNIEVVIVHRYKPSYMLALIAPFLRSSTKVIAVFHGLKEFDRKRRQIVGKIFYTKKWRIVGVSQAVVDDLVNKGLPQDRVKLIRNAINTQELVKNQLSKTDALDKLSLPDNKLLIGTLGRVKPVKGHDLLIQGFAPLCVENQNIHLAILGGGEFEATLNKIATDLNIADRVTITGDLPNGYQYLAALDIFIMPSRSEGLPIAMLEAMATSLATIGSKVGGIPEALGGDGIIIEPISVSAITSSLQHLINIGELGRQKMGRKLRQRIDEDFSIDAYHEAYRKLALEK